MTIENNAPHYRNGVNGNINDFADAYKHVNWLSSFLSKAAPYVMVALGSLYAGGWIIGPAKSTDVAALSKEVRQQREDIADLKKSHDDARDNFADFVTEWRIWSAQFKVPPPAPEPRKVVKKTQPKGLRLF
jgi:hypothetical protein